MSNLNAITFLQGVGAHVEAQVEKLPRMLLIVR